MRLTKNVLSFRLMTVLLTTVFLAAFTNLSYANVPGGGTGTGANVTVKDNGGTVVLSNGIVSITIDKSNAETTNFTFNGTNLLAGGHGGGVLYFDGSGGPELSGPTYSLTVNPADNGGAQAEVLIQSIQSPMDISVYYDLLRGQQGIYDTFILTHEAGYPAYGGAELRSNAYVGSIFDFLCVDPYRFRQMASPNDTTIAVAGAPKEVTQFTSGIYNGLTECKYGYSDPLGQLNAYGWASSKSNFGIWQTFPSHEYLDGGPMHRELTEHLGNTLLDMFGGGHYGFGYTPNIPAGTFASKTFGPAFIYANQYTGPSVSTSARAMTLYADAQAQAAAEQSAWPYSWFHPQPVGGGASGTIYPQASGRGTVSGTFAIHDTFNPGASPVSMWIGLAPADGGDFQQQYFTKQFWVETGAGGAFTIPDVVPGTYNLWAFGPGAAGTFEQANVTVAAGQSLNLGTVVWTPTRLGATVWQIGIPDRNSNEFNNGEHNLTPFSGVLPGYAGGAPHNTPAAWAAFMDYSKQYPNGVSFTVGSSDYGTDWNYCQPTVPSGASYAGSTSKIFFNLASAPTASQQARLYIAFAGLESSACILKVNGVVQTGTVMGSTDGNYAAVANSTNGFTPPNHNTDPIVRIGSNGTWGDAYLNFPATSLKAGLNEIDISNRASGFADGFEYDYLRLEMTGFAAGSVTPTPVVSTPTHTPVPATATASPTASATKTVTTTPTRTFTSTPTATASATTTATVTSTKTATATASATKTNTPVPPTATLTASATKTATSVPFTATSTSTQTLVVSATDSATPTWTSSPVPPTFTNTPLPPTATTTVTVTATASPTASASPTATVTRTPVPPTATLTRTPVPPTATPTVTRTLTPVPPTATHTPLPPTATNTPVSTGAGSLTVYFLAGVTSNTTNSPHPQIEVVNTGKAALNLNNVEVRYWFNCDCTGQSIQTWVDWAGLMPTGSTVTADVLTSVAATTLGGQTDYVSYKFSGNLVLQPGQSIQIQSRFNKSDWSNMLQNNDWSYTASTSFTQSTHITGYLNGSLVWGQAPIVSAPAAQTANLLAFPNPSTGSGVNLSVNMTGSSSSIGAKAVSTSSGIDPDGVLTFRAYSLDGQLVWVKTVDESSFESSGHSLYWNERNLENQSLSSGLYIVTVTVNSGVQSSTSTVKVAIVR
jgi:rhamnogalacturonan endolyase